MVEPQPKRFDMRRFLMTCNIALPLPVSVPRHIEPTQEPVWVRWTLIGLALTFLTLFLFIPLISVFYEALKKGVDVYLAAITEPDAVIGDRAYPDRRGYCSTA